MKHMNQSMTHTQIGIKMENESLTKKEKDWFTNNEKDLTNVQHRCFDDYIKTMSADLFMWDSNNLKVK